MRNLLTTFTEALMIMYWVIAGALALDFIYIDPALMYSDYQNPLVVAWNWSFFPIDIAFSVIGLTARFAKLKHTLTIRLETVAATLMVCAGLMAISFWTITGDFDPTWWSVNLWLIALGITNLIFGSHKTV